VEAVKFFNELQPLSPFQQLPSLWVSLEELLPRCLSSNNYPHSKGFFALKIVYLDRKMELVGFASWWKYGVVMKLQRRVRIGKNGWVIIRIMGMNLIVRHIQTYDLVLIWQI